jgi:hypothetical protein
MIRFTEYLKELKIVMPSIKDTKGVLRSKMPQIEKRDYEAYIKHMKDMGITQKKVKVDPKKLKPIQSEFAELGVIVSIKKNDDKPIVISNDNYVIDGNHRWLAAVNTKKPTLNALVFNASKDKVMAATLAFPKVIFKKHGQN